MSTRNRSAVARRRTVLSIIFEFSALSADPIPGTFQSGDATAYESGVKFRTTRAGNCVGVRFYKHSTNTGPHSVSLWSAAGALLATRVTTGETASGWQRMDFVTPIALTINTTYVASVHKNTVGSYPVASTGLVTGIFQGPLSLLADTTDGGNSVYAISSTPATTFPSTTTAGGLYYTDPVLAIDIVASPMTALQSDDFVDSIGINTHITFPHYSNLAAVKSALTTAGFRHHRTGFGALQTEWHTASQSIMTDTGVDTMWTYGNVPVGGWGTPADMKAAVKAMNIAVPGTIEVIEGANEPNIFGAAGDWVTETRDAQSGLWTAMKGDAATSSIPILAPPMGYWNQVAGYNSLGSVAAWCDIATIHDYTGGAMITDGHIDVAIGISALTAGAGKPLWCTEVGFSTAVGATDNAPGDNPVAEAQAATLLTRYYFEHFRKGLPRTYLYELIDGNSATTTSMEANYGLLHTDFTPKPAYTTIKNCITLLTDPGTAHTPAPLSLAVVGNNDTRYLLLQKRNGTYALAVWQQTEVWNNTARTVINPANITVTLTLSATKTITRYDPAIGVSVLETVSGSSYSFTCSEDVTLIGLA